MEKRHLTYLKLEVDKSPLKEALDALVKMGKLRVWEKRSLHPDDLPHHQGLPVQYKGVFGEFYILNV
jgi:hypothetical protein